MESSIIFILSILFFSSLIRSTFGFGDALIAMPLLTLAVGINTATPLIALIASVIASVILFQTWRNIDFKNILTLIIFSVIGIPLGVLFLKGSAESLVKIILSVVLILFATYKLFKPNLMKLRSNKLAFAFGLLGGILGGAYNTNGPPIIIYGTLRGWESGKFREILQGIFLPTNIFIALSHGIAGMWTSEVFLYFIYSIPVVVIALLLGTYLNRKIPSDKFSKYIYILLIAIGLYLGIRTVFF